MEAPHPLRVWELRSFLARLCLDLVGESISFEEGDALSNTAAGHVVVGVSGGIAAYKACHLVRNFKEAGSDVVVVPTPNALNFVGKATFEALSGNPVSTQVFEAIDEVRHVRVGKEAELIVVAPATADLMARLAAGRADDMLAATILMATCPVVLAPAMHTEMWENPATVANVKTLRSRGIVVLDPAHGRLTGTDTGPGRLPEPEQIAELARVAAAGYSFERSLEGTKAVVTAGGTQEEIDPVRFIANSSSGRQGFAIAEMLSQRGAEVTLIAGVTDDLPTPCGAQLVRVRSARQMKEAACLAALDADLVVMAAAVADFRPANPAGAKLKKSQDTSALMQIQLEENPDILRTLVEMRETGEIPSTTAILGFAAETGDETTSALEFAKQKLARKGCDVLMCNDVSEGKVFGQLRNRGWLLLAGGQEIEVADGSKHEVAAQIVDAAEQAMARRRQDSL